MILEARAPRHKVSGGGIDLSGGAGWVVARDETGKACAGARCFEVRHRKLLLRDGSRVHVRHIYSTLAIGARTTTGLMEFRLRRAWARLAGATEPARLIAIAKNGADGLADRDIGLLLDALTALRSA